MESNLRGDELNGAKVLCKTDGKNDRTGKRPEEKGANAADSSKCDKNNGTHRLLKIPNKRVEKRKVGGTI
jgi:hypothetical protein